MRATKTRVLIPFLAGGLLLLTACSKGKKVEDFTPPSDKAHKALEAALTYLKDGNPPGAVPGTTPQVQLVDTKLKVGQLKGFEILGEDSPNPESSVPRYFKVRLIPAKGSSQEVRYVVIGIDPLWVYRDEDYRSLSGMRK
jgi:hypothetical protein